MCENRDGLFVVPRKPGAGMGWWIGIAPNPDERFFLINLIWVEIPANQMGPVIATTKEYVRTFDSLSKAQNHLRSLDVVL